MNKTTAGDFFIGAVISVTAIISCANEEKGSDPAVLQDTTVIVPPAANTPEIEPVPVPIIVVADTSFLPPATRPDSLVAFAKTLIGVPYLYASADPAKGLDCSGFITCVFKHFNITVPRSSVDFTNYGKTIKDQDARPGDLVLFTGTDSTIRIVGHMGIVESIQHDTLRFIHSSSGKAKGVVISPLGKYYRSRFVKVIRVFPDEMFL